ncbi:BTE_HP_G0220360.mRNA.1.CDS.1 [Saccharomyces cerevisiae]|nr:BTE_HP_G0220360.mRNA.1.CDS.1 [Saccharomyces cerevisiae]CAI6427039.1 BTE_HP_G0220360.mRNA.1.CDS.1 [Saccharomyces cerevisiae]
MLLSCKSRKVYHTAKWNKSWYYLVLLNVGKSSLVNSLTNDDISIVSDIPGTKILLMQQNV